MHQVAVINPETRNETRCKQLKCFLFLFSLKDERDLPHKMISADVFLDAGFPAKALASFVPALCFKLEPSRHMLGMPAMAASVALKAPAMD